MYTGEYDRDPGENIGVTRRSFLGTTLAGGAALLAGGLNAFAARPPFIEKSIFELQNLMTSGALTSRELTADYFSRIGSLNSLLHAVIETNPDAMEIAANRDAERRAGQVRSRLHGVPILLKDNIATNDKMETTAGSLALVGSQVPEDAELVKRLRAAGAVILGKANLSEWANFRGFAPFNGWSARGGFTRNPYLLGFDPCGSSSGSAVAPAASMCAAAVGTETDGSIVCPAGNNLIVGLKPTVGLISGKGIIPIAHSQDTAGPMCRTVSDVAIMMNVLRSPTAKVARHQLPVDYTVHLKRGSLQGKRIGVDERYFTRNYGGETALVAVARQGLAAMVELGATLVPTDTGDPYADNFKFYDDEYLVLLVEFKKQIAEYLSTLKNTTMRTLADLIAFNRAHCPEEMKYFGQRVFQESQATSGDLNDPEYKAARQANLMFARGGIDGAMQRDSLHAIVAPTYSYASSPAAVAGYPDISIPVGLTPAGKPAGLWMYASYLQEPRLIAYAYDLEQALHPRSLPQFLGTEPPEPPNAGICARISERSAFAEMEAATAGPRLPYHFGTGKPFEQYGRRP
ncbi:amidase [soil metagenome]